MTTNREQQEPNSMGQAVEQLNNRTDAADQAQGVNDGGAEARSAANRDRNRNEMDEILIEE